MLISLTRPALRTPAPIIALPSFLPSFYAGSSHGALPDLLWLGPRRSPGDVGPASVIATRWTTEAWVRSVRPARSPTG